jgi:hypothetical protein
MGRAFFDQNVLFDLDSHIYNMDYFYKESGNIFGKKWFLALLNL